MLHYIIIWFLLISVLNYFILHSGRWLYTEKSANAIVVDKAVLLIQLIAIWSVIIAPFITEDNSLNIMTHVIQPNLMTTTISMIILFFIGITIAMSMQARIEKNFFVYVLYWVFCFASIITYFILILVFIPWNIENCPCQNGYFGNQCLKTCITENSVCSGHGTCMELGCACDTRFKGIFCSECVNQFNYESNCSSCNAGYSLDLDCTTCEQGRDPLDNCQSCKDGYLEDETYNSIELGCTTCKENYYRPTSNPLVGSYNKFLQYGDICTACEGFPNVCNNRGKCNHFLTPDENGDFLYNGELVLGQLANGECECDDGYAGPNCIKIQGYDNTNEESVCNGHGDVYEIYDQEENNIFETFQGIECDCDEGYVATNDEHTCSCFGTSPTNCETCIFGYYLFNSECKPCPGGGFLKSCNADVGAGVCKTDGTCSCLQSYINGGYSGDSCAECMNNNFYKIKNSIYANESGAEPEKCQACPGATGPAPNEACGGHGFCITDTRLSYWDNNSTDVSSDTFDVFKLQTKYDGTRSDLDNLVGTCVCHEGFSLNMFNLCS